MMAETIGDILREHPKYKKFMEEALKEKDREVYASMEQMEFKSQSEIKE